jgi:hypothetical protein
MSRRGRNTGTAISLFSFQDIITSVTAIMILLVLILSLELITRSKQRGVAAEERRVARELWSAVAAMEQQASAARAEMTSLQASAARVANFSVEEVRRRERLAEQRAAGLGEEIELLESARRKAGSSRRKAEADLIKERASQPAASAEHVAAMNARAEAMEEANRAERRRQEAAAEAAAGQSSPRTLVFNAPPGQPLSPRLLDVSGDGLAALGRGEAQPRHFSGPGGDFNRWLATLDATSEYVVVILRPSGIDSFDTVVAAVEKAGLAVGAELIGEAVAVQLGEGG